MGRERWRLALERASLGSLQWACGEMGCFGWLKGGTVHVSVVRMQDPLPRQDYYYLTKGTDVCAARGSSYAQG